jgi:hypothetical protein
MYYFPAVLIPCSSNPRWCLVEDQICPSKDSCSRGVGFCIVEYESALNRVDLSNGLILEDMVVIEKYGAGTRGSSGIYLKKGDRVCLQEVSSAYAYLTKKEGDTVKQGERIGFMLSVKGAVRTVKSVCEGIITLIINISWEVPEKYIILVVKEDELRRIHVREDKGGCVKERAG